MKFKDSESDIKLDQFDRSHGDLEPDRPHFSVHTSSVQPGIHIGYMSQVLSQLFAIFPNVDNLLIHTGQEYPGWQDWQDIFDSTEWLAFLRLFTIIETLHVAGRLAGQVALALEGIPEEMVTQVLPSLHRLRFQDLDRRVESTSTGRFISLRQLYGHPIIIVSLDCGG